MKTKKQIMERIEHLKECKREFLAYNKYRQVCDIIDEINVLEWVLQK